MLWFMGRTRVLRLDSNDIIKALLDSSTDGSQPTLVHFHLSILTCKGLVIELYYVVEHERPGLNNLKSS